MPEHLTPVILQQAVESEGLTVVVFPISSHSRTTQQHSGEDSEQLAAPFADAINAIKAKNDLRCSIVQRIDDVTVN